MLVVVSSTSRSSSRPSPSYDPAIVPEAPLNRLRSAGARALGVLGYELRRSDSLAYADLSLEHRALFARVSPYTQTSIERVLALADAVEYVVRRDVPGDFVECGVWRGGSSMVVALTLMRLRVSDRSVWLYDTFGTMPPAGEHDIDFADRR